MTSPSSGLPVERKGHDPAAVDAGTAEMVRSQIATHITLPAFVADRCQFDALTDGGREEWRAVFRAGLDAYLDAAGTGQADALAILREMVGEADRPLWERGRLSDRAERFDGLFARARALLDRHPEAMP